MAREFSVGSFTSSSFISGYIAREWQIFLFVGMLGESKEALRVPVLPLHGSNSQACSSALRKPAVSIADSTELR